MINSDNMSKLVSRKYLLPFILITSLFFMWGFARAVLDVLNKHFQQELDISITQSSLVQAMTYLGYFLMALPAGIIITRYGYRRGVVLGLILFCIGSFIFIPGQMAMSFQIFLLALFVIGCGLAILETAANPYAAELGDRSTAASRLNLAQSFNGLGCIIAPFTVGAILFSGDGNVALPYTVMGVVVLIVAVVFSKVKLPEIKSGSDSEEISNVSESQESLGVTIKKLWSNQTFRFGVLALFCYEIAEISINSLFINYATSDGWMTPETAAAVLSFGALTLFMVARVVGSFVMSKVSAKKVLLVCAVVTVAGALAVTANVGTLSRCGVFFCYAFEAIMFPTIFAITISEAGKSVKIASSFLMMTPIGGAVGTSLMSLVADSWSMSTAFIIPAIGYAFVLLYAIYTLKNEKRK